MRIHLSVGLRWWVAPYISALNMFCRATSMQPDADKLVQLIVKYGVKIKVKK